MENDDLGDPDLIRLESKVTKQFQDLNKRIDELIHVQRTTCLPSERRRGHSALSSGSVDNSFPGSRPPSGRNPNRSGDPVDITRKRDSSGEGGECRDTRLKEAGIKSGSSFKRLSDVWRHLASAGDLDPGDDEYGNVGFVRPRYRKTAKRVRDSDEVLLIASDEEGDTTV